MGASHNLLRRSLSLLRLLDALFQQTFWQQRRTLPPMHASYDRSELGSISKCNIRTGGDRIK
jgi:hypothetical protein